MIGQTSAVRPKRLRTAHGAAIGEPFLESLLLKAVPIGRLDLRRHLLKDIFFKSSLKSSLKISKGTLRLSRLGLDSP